MCDIHRAIASCCELPVCMLCAAASCLCAAVSFLCAAASCLCAAASCLCAAVSCLCAVVYCSHHCHRAAVITVVVL